VRYGPLIASDLDVSLDRVVATLTTYVNVQLAELGEPAPDFPAASR